MSDQPVPKIVVAVDGSAPSREALRWGVRQAHLVGGVVQAVTAWTYPDLYGWGAVGAPDWAANAREQQDAAVSAALDPADATAVVRQVLEGLTARVLLDAAAGADLLVVGSRGHGAFAGMVLGSVSLHLVTHAPCPVVVVRAADEHRSEHDRGAGATTSHAAPEHASAQA
ncbi:universal stress protein [Klenkia sp. LSe6-5]|uniref:Universal stress protein n=1 Tax=Klenkia sesuvii TaxID=3103137 RepID=A0ABU8DTK3_9ACTN